MSKLDRLLEPDEKMLTPKNAVLAVFGAAGLYFWTLIVLVVFA